MVASAEIRDRLREFFGEEKHFRFVTYVPAKSEGTRILWWMERAWEFFELANAYCKLTFPQLVDVFADCTDYGARVRHAKHLELVASWLTVQVSPSQLEAEHSIQNDDDSDSTGAA